MCLAYDIYLTNLALNVIQGNNFRTTKKRVKIPVLHFNDFIILYTYKAVTLGLFLK